MSRRFSICSSEIVLVILPTLIMRFYFCPCKPPYCKNGFSNVWPQKCSVLLLVAAVFFLRTTILEKNPSVAYSELCCFFAVLRSAFFFVCLEIVYIPNLKTLLKRHHHLSFHTIPSSCIFTLSNSSFLGRRNCNILSDSTDSTTNDILTRIAISLAPADRPAWLELFHTAASYRGSLPSLTSYIARSDIPIFRCRATALEPRFMILHESCQETNLLPRSRFWTNSSTVVMLSAYISSTNVTFETHLLPMSKVCFRLSRFPRS